MKRYQPTTPSRRNMTSIDYGAVLTVSKPVKALIHGFKRSVGRNNQGVITTRHKGSGHKRLFREIDFVYGKLDIPYTVKTVEYDPNRSGFIGLVAYKDGEKRYILLPKGARVGDVYVTGETAEIKTGNRLPLKNITVGTFIYNVEVKPNGGANVSFRGSYIELIMKMLGT
jgi:large subunit ribosomal protein L2